jgi:hypothetical protein
MKTRLLLTLVVAASVMAASCAKPQPAADPPFRITATIKDLMDSEVDKSADVLWDSVATIVSRDGIDERQPRTPEEWANVRRNAITLIEATNLLLMDGRKVARAGEKAENPEVELGPEEIQGVIDGDRASWVKFAHGLHDAAMVALKAIDEKNVQGLQDAGEGIDNACEQCHLKYWYPAGQQFDEAKKAAASRRNKS